MGFDCEVCLKNNDGKKSSIFYKREGGKIYLVLTRYFGERSEPYIVIK
jgi:hypothetical protein